MDHLRFARLDLYISFAHFYLNFSGNLGFADSTEEEEFSTALPRLPLPSPQVENIEFLQITPTSIQIQFPGITGGNLMYVEDRQFPAGKEIPWQNAIILEGNKIFTLTGLKAGVKYRLRWQAPDRQYPDIMVSTKGNNNKTGVINDPLGQPTVPSGSEDLFCFDRF